MTLIYRISEQLRLHAILFHTFFRSMRLAISLLLMPSFFIASETSQESTRFQAMEVASS